MATIGYGYDTTHMRPDGIASWKIQLGADVGFYSLGYIRNAKVNPKLLTSPDSLKRQRGFAVQVDASCQMMNTHIDIIKLLSKIGAKDTRHYIVAASGQTFGKSTIYGGTLGADWAFTVDGDMDKERYIDFKAGGKILIDATTNYDFADFLTSGTPASPDAGDALYAMLAAVGSPNINPAGIQQIAVRPTPDTVYEPLGLIRKGKLVAKSLVSSDTRGVNYMHSIQLDVDIEAQQTSSELAFLKNTLDVDYQITLVNGETLTLDNILGVVWDVNYATDANDVAFIKFTGTGVIQLASWAGLWS